MSSTVLISLSFQSLLSPTHVAFVCVPTSISKQVLHAGDEHNASGPFDPNDLETNIVRSGAMAGLACLKEGDRGEHMAYHYLKGRIGAIGFVACMHIVGVYYSLISWHRPLVLWNTGKEKQRPVHVAVVEAFALAAGHVRDKTLRREVGACVHMDCM